MMLFYSLIVPDCLEIPRYSSFNKIDLPKRICYRILFAVHIKPWWVLPKLNSWCSTSVSWVLSIWPLTHWHYYSCMNSHISKKYKGITNPQFYHSYIISIKNQWSIGLPTKMLHASWYIILITNNWPLHPCIYK